jgi:hypothetical protein
MKNLCIEILVEESSMKHFLENILPQILPDGINLNQNCFIRAHEGKQHLKKEIPKKIRAYKHLKTPVKVVIIQDQDSSDCKVLKAELTQMVNNSGPLPHLVRIACRELESWYIGDMGAIERVYPKFKAEKYRNWDKFRNPDLCNASHELKKIIPEFQKGVASREISKYIKLSNNKSISFMHLINGLQSFLNN